MTLLEMYMVESLLGFGALMGLLVWILINKVK